jgi:cytoskeleton protein RodZ
MSEVAQALGLRLKAERERRGMSAQKMADDMHLDGWVIEALEAGDYQRIGPAVYAKGHLKKYATLLGVSAVEGSAATDGKPAAGGAPVPIIRLDQPAPGGRLPSRVLVGAAVAAALVGGAVWLRPWHAASGPKATTAAHPRPVAGEAARAVPAEDAPNEAAPGEAALSEATLTEARSSGASSSGASSSGASSSGASSSEATNRPTPSEAAASEAVNEGGRAAAIGPVQTAALSAAAPRQGAVDLTPGVGRARLRLSFSADSRVDIYDFSGKHIFSGNGRANSVTTIAGIAPFRVYLGFASGVQLEVNNRAVAIGPQFVTGDVARFEAGADGVLRREAPSPPSNGVPAASASPRG